MKRRLIPLLGVVLAASTALTAQQPALQAPPTVDRAFDEAAAYVPDMTRLAGSTSELRDLVDRFALDRQALQRFYTVPGSNERRARLRAFQRAWLDALPKIGFAKLSREGQVDYVLLRNHIEYRSSCSIARSAMSARPTRCSRSKRTSSSSRKTGRSCGS